jgi:hypothetical protein
VQQEAEGLMVKILQGPAVLPELNMLSAAQLCGRPQSAHSDANTPGTTELHQHRQRPDDQYNLLLAQRLMRMDAIAG